MCSKHTLLVVYTLASEYFYIIDIGNSLKEVCSIGYSLFFLPSILSVYAPHHVFVYCYPCSFHWLSASWSVSAPMHSAHGHQQVYHSFSSMYFVVKLPVLPMLKIHDSDLLVYILYSITQNEIWPTHLLMATSQLSSPFVRCNTSNVIREDKGGSLPWIP